MGDNPATGAAPIGFSAGGAWRGSRAVLAIVPGAVAFGLLYGFLAGQKGLSPLEIGLSSALIFAGASQLLALELWREPLPLFTLLMGVAIINLRHLLMGPVLLPWLARVSPPRAYASLWFMTDESWGVSVGEMRRGGRDAAFLLGAGLTLYVTWIGASVLGSLAGDISGFIERWGLDYLTTAFFVALLAAFWRGRGDLLPWLTAAGVAVVAKVTLGGTWYIVLGALTGSLLGAVRDVRRSG
jgi:4-azaleucine resistance transporter AzlC